MGPKLFRGAILKTEKHHSRDTLTYAPKLFKIGSKMLPKWLQNRLQNGSKILLKSTPKGAPKGTPLGEPFLTNGPSETLTFEATWLDNGTGSAEQKENFRCHGGERSNMTNQRINNLNARD